MDFKNLIFLLLIIVLSNQLLAQSTTDNFTSSNLPIIIIYTNGQEILDSPKINSHMGIIDNGEGNRNFISDSLNGYNGNISIEIRGATSQSFPKKQYSFETQDSTGENNNVVLLGMPKENDWILSAPFSDKSLIRNALQYSLANELGWYASRTRFCEVVINNEYMGVYVLTEKIKRDKNRVNIAKLTDQDNAGDSQTGGYIIKLDKDVGDNIGGWYSSFPQNFSEDERIFFQYHYPKEDDITFSQKNYIHQFMQDFESTMNSVNYTDPTNGYHKFINTDSFVDYFILSEISKNIDSYRLSVFMYKDRDDNGGKLAMGPIWDFNAAYGNVNYDNANLISGWYKDSYYGGNYQIPFWWDKLFSDSTFVKKTQTRWTELRNTKLSDSVIYQKIDSLTTLLDEAQERNFDKWNILGQYVWPNNYVGGTYENEIGYLKNWITERTEWIDSNITKSMIADSSTIEDAGEFALQFDGNNDFVNCGNDETLNITGDQITLEAWINPSQWKNNSWEGVIISKDQFGDGTDHGYVLRCGNNGQVDLVLGNGSWHELYSPQNLMKLNEWNHIAGTYDGTRMKIFINGEEVVRKYDSFSIKGTKKHLFIGSSPADNSRSFNGKIDEVRVWEKARTGEEIINTMYTDLGNEFLANSESGLVGYWKFNEGSTQTTKDLTGTNIGSIGLLFSEDINDPIWVENSNSPAVGVKKTSHISIDEFSLSQNYPNPFNPQTKIDFSIPIIGNVKLTVFDILGRGVTTLVDEVKQVGNHRIEFDATELVSGIYIYQLVSQNHIITKKMILLR